MSITVFRSADWQGRPTRAIIDLDAIDHNVRALQRRVGGHSQVWAVLKANGYGHGASAVAAAAIEAGAARCCVAITAEGAQLRHDGIKAPILILGYTPPSEADTVVRDGLTPTVTTRDTALALAAAAQRHRTRLSIHVKLDTGMNRYGLAVEDFHPFLAFLERLPEIRVEGVFTHFATADEPDKDFCRRQFRAFLDATRGLEGRVIRHVANSAAAIDCPEMALDAVRIGIALYGLYPSSDVTREVRLRPALTWQSVVARVMELAPGQAVSYGLTWTARRPSTVALVPCGYADGLRRALSNRGRMLVHGRPAPIIGRVCMDQCIVDVTDVPTVAAGDPVVVLGTSGDHAISADEHAAIADTINYEIVCGLSERVPRLYIRSDELVGVRDSLDRVVVAP